ncbi:MAG TPA: hypothetical protein VEY51_05770 [Chondromyces sp.]|nr:hypothetical protein [Chondromyces sp.]
MKKNRLFILFLLTLSLLLSACQSKDEQTIGNTDENPTKKLAYPMNQEELWYDSDRENTFKRTVLVGFTEITLPLPGFFLDEK